MSLGTLRFYLCGHILVSLTLLLNSFYLSYAQTIPDLCHPHDKNVLLCIKTRLGNPTSLASWDPKTDCCIYWNDVRCNEHGRVTSVGVLDATDIVAPIPPFFDTLPWLTQLHFQNAPNISGPIPSYIGKLTNLKSFIVSGTSITGPIPDFLGGFTNLIQLDLSSNKFTGPIPSILGRLKSLGYLDLSSNRLTGLVPLALAQLTNLSLLHLGSNKLSGQIPAFLARMKNLNAIDLESNSLSGPIPSNLGLQPNLTSLHLTDNKLTGSIPKSMGRGNLVLLSLAHNMLTGDASFLFDKKNSGIIDIQVNNNLLKFDFSNVDLSPNLSGFNISHNMIYGSLPKRFGSLRVDSVDVSYNQLCGPIPNGRRFKRVDARIFSHNKCLCGGPLPACK